MTATGFFGQSGKEWIISVCFVAAIFIFSVIKSFSVRSNTPDNPRKISDNLLIMTLLFCLAAFLGNTDEKPAPQAQDRTVSVKMSI